jgi:hypothetical protein
MNTADIRSQSTTQWAFWAVAIPLTLIVVIASLWGADALPSLTGALGRNRGVALQGEYAPVVERERERDGRYYEEREYYPEYEPMVVRERSPDRRITRSRTAVRY